MEIEESLLNPKDVASIIHVDPAHAYRLMMSGAMGAVTDVSTPGSQRRSPRVTRQGLADFLTSRQVATQSESNPTEGN